jgi:threonine synthase
MKTIAFEIAEQLGLQQNEDRFVAPDWYIQAVSGGLGPVGVWKGFRELKEMGFIDKLPKLALIQSEGCAPMVNSFKKGLEEAENVLDPKTLIATVATGSPGPVYPYLRNIILEHGGLMETVSDSEAFRAMHVMAQMDGLSMEPAAAMACAGLIKLISQQIIKPEETVVVNCSGHTFPVEKHLLDERRVRDLDLKTTRLDHLAGEGVLTALDQLDERVKSIAIIEDDPNAARLLRRILQAKGNYNLLEAQDGKSGLEIIRKEQPDLVLLDLMMPNIDGFGVLEAMKADENLKQIPVIIVTAKELTASDKSRLSGQVEALLQKGAFMEDDLLEGIIEALD